MDRLNEWRYVERCNANVQVCFDVACGCFDIGSNARNVTCNNLITNVVHQYVVVLAEGVNGLDVLIQNVCRPTGCHTVDRTIEREC